MTLLYQAVQILYWVVLSAWFGSLVFLVLGSTAVFRAVRKLEVRSSRYADPALEDDQTTIVAGEIMGSLLARLAQMQMFCAVALLPLMVAQFLVIDLNGTNLIAALVRVGLWFLLAVLLLYEWWFHYPRTWRLRQQSLEETEDLDAANAARDDFAREQRKSEHLFLATICLLIGMVMLSANISPRAHSVSPPAATTITP